MYSQQTRHVQLRTPTHDRRLHQPQWALCLCAALALTACGGDGSTPAKPTTPGATLTCTLPQVLNAAGTACVTPDTPVGTVQVTGVVLVPAIPHYGEAFTLTVNGKNLSDTLAVTLPGCKFVAQAGGTGASRSYVCTPRKTGELTGSVAATSGGSELKAFTVTVTEPVQTLTDTGVGPAVCNVAGRGDLASCANTNAIALSDQQDGMTGLDATKGSSSDGKLGFRYAKLAQDGSELPASAGTWACIKDQVTGLVWEVKSSANANSGYAYGDALSFRDMTNLAGLCGAKDWRIPSVQELMSLKDYGVGDAGVARLDEAWLGQSSPGGYWSSTTHVENPGAYQWYVDFGGTVTGTDPLTIGFGVRLVRGSSGVPATRYTPLFDGSEIRDNLTGLVWRRCVEGMTWDGATCSGTPARFTHGEALAHAKAQTTIARANQEVGWRAPNIKELFSMVDTGKANPALDASAFPGNLNQGGWNYWSSTPVPGALDVAMSVRFDNGGVEAKLRGDDPLSGNPAKTVALRLVRYFP